MFGLVVNNDCDAGYTLYYHAIVKEKIKRG